MRGRDYRRRMAAKKERRRIKIVTTYGCLPRVGYVQCGWVDGVWKPVGEYIKYPKHSHMQKYLKRLSNRTVRRSGTFPKGNAYRKCMEYKWQFW